MNAPKTRPGWFLTWASILLAALLPLFLLFLPHLMTMYLTFVLDHSGVRHADSFQWRGVEYVYAPGRYHEGKTIAKANDGSSIVAVKEDPSHTFLVLRDFLDDDLYVREDYEIPTSGQITVANWNGNTITDEAFLDALTTCLALTSVDLTYQTDAPYVQENGRAMSELYVGYEDCPVATCFLGYLGTVDGVWHITADISETGEGEYRVSCRAIPPEYVDTLAAWAE